MTQSLTDAAARPGATSPVARAASRADDLAIAGLTPLSTCDWPGKLVATVFLQGCPLACGYCHNPSLLDPRTPGVISWASVLELLAKRHGLLDGLVFSGGEPTRQAGLPEAMRQVRDAGFAVGLHTSGSYLRRFAQVLPLVDWVGLDIKAPEHMYGAVTGVQTAGATAFACLDLALASGVALQVRTTVDPTTMTLGDVADLIVTLRERGVTEHVLQQVRTEGARPEYAAALAKVDGPR